MCKNRKKDAYEVCFGPNQYDDLLIELTEIEQGSYWHLRLYQGQGRQLCDGQLRAADFRCASSV